MTGPVDSATGPAADTAAAMRLHAAPPRVSRLSRRVLIALGLLAGLGIGGALIVALQPVERAGAPEELITTERRQTAEGLQELPGDYGDIPWLGPPLPGDLGGPILKAQQEGRPVPASDIRAPTVDPEEQQRLAEQEAARTSTLFVQTPPGSGSATSGAGASQAGRAVPSGAQGALVGTRTYQSPVSEERIMPPASPYLLQAGSVIPAALITGIRSDLPGPITAQVTEHVYDSPTGSLLLIPQGSRLIGEYDDSVSFGQRRVLLVWTRLIFPDGRSILLERLPGSDAGGHAGLEDEVDHHWGDLMKAAGLSTLLAAGTELAADDDDRLTRAIREGAVDTIDETGQQIIQRQLQIEPTLTIRPGFPVRVMVGRDLVVEPQGG